MTRKETNRILYFPIKLFVLFLVFTELLFFLGPYDYKITNAIIVLLYLVLLNIALWCGFRTGITKFKTKVDKHLFISTKKILLVSLLLTIYSIVNTLSSRGVSIGNFIPYLIFSIINPGEAYYAEVEIVSETSYFLMLLQIIVSSAIPIGVYEWSNLKLPYRLILVAIIFLTISNWLCIGTRKGVVDIIVTCFMFYVAKNKDVVEDRSKRRKVAMILFISVGVFLSYFIISNISRHEYTGSAESYFDKTNIRELYIKYVPDDVILVLRNVQSYLTQGYYSLSKSFEVGIIPPAPMGSSWFTIALAKKFGYDPTPKTYTCILEQTAGIDMSINWHTIYVWIANSVTFLGVPFVVFLIGLLFGMTWKDTVLGGSTMAIPLLSLVIIMVFYFFANNQVLSFDFVPFIFWLIYYLLKRNYKLKVSSYSVK